VQPISLFDFPTNVLTLHDDTLLILQIVMLLSRIR